MRPLTHDEMRRTTRYSRFCDLFSHSQQASKQLWRPPDHSACSHWRDPSFSVYPLCTHQQHQQQQEEIDDKEEMEDKEEEEMDFLLLLTGTHLLKEVPIAGGVTLLSPCPCFVAVTCMRFRELIVLSSLLWT